MQGRIARSGDQLGALITREREAQGLTQAELGDRTSMRQATISALENGRPGSRISTLMEVLAALDLELVVQPRTRGSAEDMEALF